MSCVIKIPDIIFSFVAGCSVGWVAKELLQGYDLHAGFWINALLFLGLPLFTLFCLWISSLIGKWLLFAHQASKHLLVGAIATVFDLKVFELLLWTFGQLFFVNALIPKTISFLLATFAKYWGNKFWAFEHNNKDNLLKEFFSFFAVTLVGLVIDLSVFWYLMQITGPLFAIPSEVWLKASVIIAGSSAAIWNFTAYKFLVFKK